MTRKTVEHLLYFIDQGFAGLDIDDPGESQALLPNLRTITNEEWSWLPAGIERSIRQMVGHVAACKCMYDNYAFGDSQMTWDDPAGSLGCTMEAMQSAPVLPSGEPPMAAVVEWLSDAHNRFREHCAALDDSQLLAERPVPSGGRREIRWIIANLVSHDTYHAGEINHLRSLSRADDRWAWKSD